MLFLFLNRINNLSAEGISVQKSFTDNSVVECVFMKAYDRFENTIHAAVVPQDFFFFFKPHRLSAKVTYVPSGDDVYVGHSSRSLTVVTDNTLKLCRSTVYIEYDYD